MVIKVTYEGYHMLVACICTKTAITLKAGTAYIEKSFGGTVDFFIFSRPIREHTMVLLSLFLQL